MGACEMAPIVLNETGERRSQVDFGEIKTVWPALATNRPRAVEWRLAHEHVVPVGWPTVGCSTAAGSGEVEMCGVVLTLWEIAPR